MLLINFIFLSISYCKKQLKQLLHSKDIDRTLTTAECSKLCQTLSTYFVDKITILKQSIIDKLSALNDDYHFYPPPHSGPCLDTISPVTAPEVYRILSSISNKSCRLDFIPTSLIKACPSVFTDLITTLANLSFQQACFPILFKKAIVTPRLKKPDLDKDLPSSYRPISNLNNIAKIIERIFLSRLQPHILSSPNFNPLQSAYRKSHSTETALLNSLNHIYNSYGSCLSRSECRIRHHRPQHSVSEAVL